MKKQISILTNAGIISPVELRKLTAIARSYACESFQFTDRNEILLDVSDADVRTLMAVAGRNNFLCCEGVSTVKSLVTSYQANGILKTTSWLTDDVYLDIVGNFHAHSSLRINVVDPLQALVPLFTGQLNFIASHHKNFWYLYLNLPGFTQGEYWPALIYTDDIFSITRNIEQIQSSTSVTSVNELFESIDNSSIHNSRTVDKELSLEQRFIPTFEGWHTGHSACWLGIYTKNYHYTLDFIEDLCDLCVDRDIAKLHITSWRSLIVKGIREQDRIPWETLLGKHGLNTRHSYAELYWQLPAVNDEILEFKKKIVEYFYSLDANTFGLYFAVSSGTSPVYGNIIIQHVGNQKFSLFYTPEFSPNATEWIAFQQDVSVDDLVERLHQLSLHYHSHKESTVPARRHRPAEGALVTTKLYQCKTCLTIYNEKVGDIVNQIAAGTPFGDLPPNYCCPVCDGGIDEYQRMEHVDMISKIENN